MISIALYQLSIVALFAAGVGACLSRIILSRRLTAATDEGRLAGRKALALEVYRIQNSMPPHEAPRAIQDLCFRAHSSGRQ